jgi:hypothetical protein
MVMLLKPVVPLSPVTVKDTVVVVTDWFFAIVTLDICELVTFPLIASPTISPLSVVANAVVEDGGGIGDDVAVGAGAAVGVGFGVSVGVAVRVGDGVEAGVGFGVAVGLRVGVGVVV